MADSIDAQTRQENIEQEGVPVTNVVRTSAQTEREVIDLSNDDNTNGGSGRNEGNSTESVTLKHSEITVYKGDEFSQIRKAYHSIFERQSRALPPNIPLSRKFLDMALAVSSADKKHIMDRHRKEWKAAMNLAGKRLREEKEKMEYFLDEEIARPRDCRTFRMEILEGYVRRYKEHKKNANLLEKMFEDLKEL
ncbi:hypothetical protein NU195Hw_g7620t1 [Hortaea werneckii]